MNIEYQSFSNLILLPIIILNYTKNRWNSALQEETNFHSETRRKVSTEKSKIIRNVFCWKRRYQERRYTMVEHNYLK